MSTTAPRTIHHLVAKERRHMALRGAVRKVRQFSNRVPTAVWVSAGVAGLLLALVPALPRLRMLAHR